MILKEQLAYLRDKFVDTSWSNPGLETNVNLAPALLTGRFPARYSFSVMGSSITMPDNESLFELYTFTYTPTEFFRTGDQYVNCWIRLDDFCSHCNAWVYPSYGYSLKTVRYSDTWLCYLPNGTLLMATKYREDLVPVRQDLVLVVRSSNDTLNVDIDVNETILETTHDISKVLTEYVNDPNQDQLTYIVDGVYVPYPSSSNLAIGHSVTKIRDTSMVDISDINIRELNSYSYEGRQYYLIDLSKDNNTNEIYSFRDAAIWLMNSERGRRLVFINDYDAMQVTNTIIAVSVDYIQKLAGELHWSMDGSQLRVCTKTGSPQQYFINNDNYWRSINSIDYRVRMDALEGVISAPEVMTAQWQQGSKYNAMLDMLYSGLTKDVVGDAIPVSTWDYYVNRPVSQATIYGNNLTELPPAVCPLRPIISYKDGYVDWFNPDHVSDENNALRIGYSSDVFSSTSKLVPLADICCPAVFDVTEPTTPKLLTDGNGYTVMQNSIRIDDDIGRPLTLDLATTDVVEVNYTSRSFSLDGINPQLGSFTLIYGNRTLVPFVDYFVEQEMIVIWCADVPDEGTLTYIYQPSLTPAGDTIEYGFIYNGRISIGGNYLGFDPQNYHIIYDGKVLLPSDMDWDNPFVTSSRNFENGKPFAVVKPLLSNTDDVVVMVTRRMEYEQRIAEISDFKNMHVPFPKPNTSVYKERYRLVSAFMSMIVKSLEADQIDYRPSSVANFGLDALLVDHLPILERGLDAITHDLDWNVIEYRGHGEPDPKPVNGQMYMFLEQVNKVYLKERIQMNHNFRIID